MTDAAPAVFVALEASALGAAIRQSTWIYMAANVGHIVSLVVFAGAIAVMDLRLAGALAATAPGAVLRTFRNVAIAGFAGLALTGAVLFTAEASHVIINPVFQVKLALIALGLANLAVFEFFTASRVRDLPPQRPLPKAARIAGIASFAIWLAVAAAGRTIAYL
ncbi:MAG: hypothetical protein KJZ73_01860 [Pseudorhodoplanes sp.]|nr:hypothetical protein [Pseudorhodoplanes sp.]MBW7947724.1 hypothetical protein [Pseudorhodoplanes sp.]MCL4709966.1 hypothetical protein [Pseudorhodoplanes sp.]MCQ3942376.1 hypothetical protein [Alphaproteobacteria bacterium]GIK79562.1 MAG: hypothetical protein BroJett024_06670 [Alphaproteobacteria bacterium]